jgi:hypothetical protein
MAKEEPLFKVIVEMFSIEWSEKYGRSFINEANDKKLISILSKEAGIYAFYNSEFEIIYLGKTNDNLWAEMKSAYNRTMPHYKRYRVKHPRSRFVSTKSGKVRKLVLLPLQVWEAATYFSAYAVQRDHIDDVERLLIRLMPNDLLNKRMEGNSLEAYVVKVPV